MGSQGDMISRPGFGRRVDHAVSADPKLLNPTPNSNMGALKIRISFGAHYTIVIIRNPQNSIGNY